MTHPARALLMLLAAYLVLSLSRSAQPFRAFTLALAGVLLLNVFAPLGSVNRAALLGLAKGRKVRTCPLSLIFKKRLDYISLFKMVFTC